LTYEAKNADRISDYELKLMDIDSDTLGIPDTEYDVCVTMPSSEFGRIVRDLSALGESVKIDVSKDGVRFSAEGESANGNILLKQSESARRKFKEAGKEKKEKKSKVKKEDGEEDDEEDEPESEEEGSSKKKKTKVKKEEGGSDVEMVDDDDDDEAKPDEDEDDEEDSESNSKKRKKAPSKASKPSKRTKRSEDDDDEAEEGVSIDMNQAVSLTFSLKYLVNFSKSTSLSRRVQLMMSADVPLLVAYQFTQGKIHYYLAPKIGDD